MPSARSALPGLVLLILLAALGALSVAAVSPPAPVAADAPAGDFSAERAFRHVERIGAQVHPAGSAAAGEVRSDITEALRQAGLQPREQRAIGGTGALSGPYGMADVRNVVAELPGSNPTGATFLVAHYDSVQVSYGGNDDGAGVATLLETARALAAGPRPANNTVFLFTDAEEACLCGAEAFVHQDPVAAGGGVVLNVESRGSHGPAVMFETSAGNSGVVDVYGAAVPFPVATSFAVEVYRALPNDTDFTPFRESGRFAGLNSAYIDGSAVYHSPQDTPRAMDHASLQQHGANTLALARAFGAADIPALAAPGNTDRSYFPVFGTLVRYPGWLAWPLALAAVLAVAALAVLARNRMLTSWPRAAVGFGAALIPLVLAPVAAQLLWALLVAIRPGYGNMIDPWNPGWFRGCVVALVAAIVACWFGLLRRRCGGWSLAIGGLGWLAVIGVVLAAVAPGGSYLAALPALAGAVAGMAAVSTDRGFVRWAALGLGGAVAVVILVPTVWLFFPALGLATGAAGALFAVLLGLAVLPVLDLLYPAVAARRPKREVRQAEATDAEAAQRASVPAGDVRRQRRWSAAPAAFAAVAAVAFLLAGLLTDRFDAEHPAPAHLAYLLDTTSQKARWASTDDRPGEWVRQYVTGPEDLAGFGIIGTEVQIGPAPVADLPPPAVRVAAGSATATGRTVSVTITPRRPVRLVYFEIPRAAVVGVTVAGRAVPITGADRPIGVVFHAPPPGGVTVVLALSTASPVTLRVMDGSDGLQSLPGFRERPTNVGVKGSHTSEMVLVATAVTV